MKVLVLGGSGMAGHLISIYFKENGHEVTIITRNKFEHCDNIIGDITNFSWLKNIVIYGKYDVVINAVGILNNKAEENKSMAIILNSYLPHFLSEITKNIKTKIIHMSTDCVFSGLEGNYKEDSFKDGYTFYDRTKALGEIENNKDLTFRNSIIGPDINENGIGLFNWFMKQKEPINGYCGAIWTGVTTLTLAKAMEKAAQTNLSGVYNLVNNEKITKFDLLVLINEKTNQNNIEIFKNNEFKIDKSLINTRKDFDFEIPTYENMIIEMVEWIKDHKNLYPHYMF